MFATPRRTPTSETTWQIRPLTNPKLKLVVSEFCFRDCVLGGLVFWCMLGRLGTTFQVSKVGGKHIHENNGKRSLRPAARR